MSPSRRPRYFRIVYYDRDAKTFNASEVVTDDSATADRTVELQMSGRNVNISTTNLELAPENVPTLEMLFRGAPDGYKHDPHLRW